MSVSDLVTALTRPAKILIVDDDKMICELIPVFLKGFDCECVCVSSGEDAMATLAKLKVDLVFLDLKLPGASGLDVLKFIKNTQPELPVVIMSGYADDLMVAEARKLGILSFVDKPMSFNAGTITKIFEEALTIFKIRFSREALPVAPSSPAVISVTVKDDGTTTTFLPQPLPAPV